MPAPALGPVRAPRTHTSLPPCATVNSSSYLSPNWLSPLSTCSCTLPRPSCRLRFLNSSRMHFLTNLRSNEGCHSPSPYLQDQVGHTKPKRKREVTPKVSRWRRFYVGGHSCTKGRKTVKGIGQRSTRWMTWQSGHVSHPDLWGTKIFVNFKGL
jgi:hypothetical protein